MLTCSMQLLWAFVSWSDGQFQSVFIHYYNFMLDAHLYGSFTGNCSGRSYFLFVVRRSTVFY